jgi:hypothetical protein
MTHAHGPANRENNFYSRRERSYFIKMKPLTIGVGVTLRHLDSVPLTDNNKGWIDKKYSEKYIFAKIFHSKNTILKSGFYFYISKSSCCVIVVISYIISYRLSNFMIKIFNSS